MGHATEKDALSDTVVKFRPDDSDEEQRPVRIGLVQVQNWRLREWFPYSLNPITVPLGLFSDRDNRESWNEVKLAHLDSLIRRGHTDAGQRQDSAAEATRCMLARFEALEQRIRLQHSRDGVDDDVFKANGWSDSREALEALLLDCAFVLEQLLRHWEAGTRSITVMRPGRYRRELVQFCNQIPYMLHQELMRLVKLPAAAPPEKCGGGGSRDGFLVRLAIGYILAEEASEWLLTQYKGPVHHLLHLVHLHLASAVEQRPVTPPPPPPPQGSLLVWPFRKCEAFRYAAKRTLRRPRRRSQLLEAAWWSYGMIPPAADLHRVGIRLRPPMKSASCSLADVRFDEQDGGVLELPSLDMDGFDFQLLVNLAALELEWEWGSSQRLFLSYAVFMSNLMTSESDMNVLQGAGVVARKMTRMVSDGNLYWVALEQLAELNNGRELHAHFGGV